jgi:hypothetical protein
LKRTQKHHPIVGLTDNKTVATMKRDEEFQFNENADSSQARVMDEKAISGEAMLVAAPGGQTKRGLKSRHIQFL